MRQLCRQVGSFARKQRAAVFAGVELVGAPYAVTPQVPHATGLGNSGGAMATILDQGNGVGSAELLNFFKRLDEAKKMAYEQGADRTVATRQACFEFSQVHCQVGPQRVKPDFGTQENCRVQHGSAMVGWRKYCGAWPDTAQTIGVGQCVAAAYITA